MDSRSGLGRQADRAWISLPPRLLDVHGSRAYVLRDSKLLQVDMARTDSPRIAQVVDLPFETESFRVWGDFAYVVGRHEERLVVDFRVSPARLAGVHDLVDWVSGVQFAEGMACRLDENLLEVAHVDASAEDGAVPRAARVRLPVGTP